MGNMMWLLISVLRVLTWPEHHAAESVVFDSPEGMAAVWLADGGKPADVPQVDFDKETVLALFGGEGHGEKVEIQSVRLMQAGNDFPRNTVVVLYKVIAP